MSAERSPSRSRLLPKVVADYLGSLPLGTDVRNDTVLDLNAGRGNSCFAFVQRGYGSVYGISDKTPLRNDAKKRRLDELVGAHKLHFFKNIAELHFSPAPPQFNVVLLNEKFQGSLPGIRARWVREAQAHTLPGGVNLVSGFVKPEELTEDVKKLKLLDPDELSKYYESAGWNIVAAAARTTMSRPDSNGAIVDVPISTIWAEKPQE